MVGSALVVLIAGVGLWHLATGPRCIGDCRGIPTDCEGIDAWVADVRADEAWPRSPGSGLRQGTYRARMPYRGGALCGSTTWAVDALDPRVVAWLIEASDSDGTVVVTMRYGNPGSCGGPVVLDAVGLELSGWELVLATWAAARAT